MLLAECDFYWFELWTRKKRLVLQCDGLQPPFLLLPERPCFQRRRVNCPTILQSSKLSLVPSFCRCSRLRIKLWILCNCQGQRWPLTHERSYEAVCRCRRFHGRCSTLYSFDQHHGMTCICALTNYFELSKPWSLSRSCFGQ